jgi:hypothetical protein
MTFPAAGKYLISLPPSITGPVITTSADLFNALQDAVGCNHVARHDTLDDTFLVYDNAGNCSRCDYNLAGCVDEPGGTGCGCFCINTAEGWGYFVDVGAGTFRMIAQDDPSFYFTLEGAGPLSLTGTHLISPPYNAFAISASMLFAELGGVGQVLSIERFLTSTGEFQVYSPGLPDFPLRCGEGYVVRLASWTLFAPARTGTAPGECSIGGPSPCGQSPFPTCDGLCPAGARCAEGGAGFECECMPCVTPGLVGGAIWRSPIDMIWDLDPCSNAYNVYRHTGPLLDPDGDGVASSYGDCYQADWPPPAVMDFADPPLGDIRHYVVTGESDLGEGPMGYASNFGARPNTTPCP